MLAWSGNSSDMNPAENLRSVVKKHLGKMDSSTEKRMATNVIKQWFHDCGMKNICSKLVESMPGHVQEVILKKEGHIAY
jgi:hypothetical protein